MGLLRNRRDVFVGGFGALACACTARAVSTPPPASTGDAARRLEAIEASVGGRVGVFAIDSGSGRQIARRADERFAMCSTFKWLLAAAVLERADRGEISADERIAYGPADLLEYAPATRAHVTTGGMTVAALSRAAVTVSDNTAANLLLARLGGPAAVTRFARAIGDTETRLDRTEPGLNANEPDDPRDTTTPRTMVGAMHAVLLGNALSPSARDRLLGWLRACATGATRLRAGIPAGWTAGDKTGTGMRGAANDVAIFWPPGRPPILVASYMSDSTASVEALGAAHAEVGRLVALLL